MAPSSVAALHAAHAGELRAFLFGVLRDAGLAEEALQAAFCKVIEQGHTARTDSIKGWLFRVAYHEALVLRRRQAVEKRSLGHLGLLPARQPERPAERLEQDETARHVRLALDRLPPEQKTIVLMKIFENKTFAEIALELHLPLGTVLTRMRTALQKLRSELPDGGE